MAIQKKRRHIHQSTQQRQRSNPRRRNLLRRHRQKPHRNNTPRIHQQHHKTRNTNPPHHRPRIPRTTRNPHNRPRNTEPTTKSPNEPTKTPRDNPKIYPRHRPTKPHQTMNLKTIIEIILAIIVLNYLFRPKKKQK